MRYQGGCLLPDAECRAPNAWCLLPSSPALLPLPLAMATPRDTLLAVAVGNSRCRLGLFERGELRGPVSLANDDLEAIAARAAEMLAGETPVVVASVNEPVSERLGALLAAGGAGVYRIGRDLPILIRHSLRDERTVGQDRLLNAIGAYSRAQQACVVIDAGTAITCDFVDGEGTFHGGAIGPGLKMMLDALHEKTAALPPVGPQRPEADAQGKDTPGAMRLGAWAAARGMARVLIDRYAESYGAYPQVVATGGDAALLFEDEPLVEHIVPDLQLMGIERLCRMVLGGEGGDGGLGGNGAPGSGGAGG